MDDEKVIEGEIAETEDGGNAQVVVSLESSIKSHISSIDNLEEELKKQKEMLDDIFANDETYQKHLEASKEATKIKAATKKQILNQPQAKELDQKIKSMRSEIKEQEAALSDYLQEYNRMTGVTEIEGEDGEVREIVYVAKLVKRK